MRKVRKYKFTEKEKQILFLMLNAARNEEFGDKRPEDVVRDSYDGNEDAYLSRMLRWHNIDREKLRKIAKNWPG